MKWRRKEKLIEKSVTLSFKGRTYILKPGDTFNIYPSVNITGDLIGVLEPSVSLPVRVVSID